MGGDHPRVTRLAVRDMPGSAKPHEQLEDAGIDAGAIAAAARELVGAPAGASA
jgi:transketolase